MKNKKLRYYKKPFSKVLSAIKALQEKTASKQLLLDIKRDIEAHFNTPAGVISNYCGIYGKTAAKLLVQNYPEILSEEEVNLYADKKVFMLNNRIYDLAINNMKINVQPMILKMLNDYVRDKDINASYVPETIIVGYPETLCGNYILPQKKKTAD